MQIKKVIKKSGIYKIINLINNKVYVESTTNLFKRANDHFKILQKGKHHNKHLQLSFNKYGEEFFKFEVIEYCEKESLIEREQFYINKYSACTSGYNICTVGRSRLGVKASEETKLKLSCTAKNRKFSEEKKKIISKKISDSKKGIPRSVETKQKLSLINKGKAAWNKGIPMTVETKQKLSAINKGVKTNRSMSKESRLKISLAHKGRKHTDKSRLNMSIAHIGKKLPLETRLKMSESHIKYWENKNSFGLLQ